MSSVTHTYAHFLSFSRLRASPKPGPRQPCGDNYWTLIDAVTQHSSTKVVTTLGVPSVLSEDTSGIAAAVEMAKVTIFCGCVEIFDY